MLHTCSRDRVETVRRSGTMSPILSILRPHSCQAFQLSFLICLDPEIVFNPHQFYTKRESYCSLRTKMKPPCIYNASCA